MVIYADVIFFINLISSYVQLYILARTVYKTKPKKIRLLAASAVGSVAATVIFCTEMQPIWFWIVRILSVFAMVVIALYDKGRRVAEQIMWFILLGGIIMFSMIFILSVAGSELGIISKGGILYFDIPQSVFIVAFICSYAVLTVFMRLLKNRKAKKYYTVTVLHNGREITVTALFDSGNMLKEPITGKCVSIVEWREVKKLFAADYGYEDIENHAEEMKLWVVPYKSVGNPVGILFAFMADRVSIPEEKKTIDKTFVAIYGTELSKNKEYRALLNAGLL